MSLPSGKVKILYVDDEDVNLFIFGELFKDHFDVVTTSSVEEALRIIKDSSKAVQLVITDLKMHPVNGMTFVVRARDEGIRLPICVLSAFPKTQEMETALSTGLVSAFFSKPLDADLIEQHVNQLVSDFKN